MPKKGQKRTAEHKAKMLEASAKALARRGLNGGRAQLRQREIRVAIASGLSPVQIQDLFAERWRCDPRTVRSYIHTARIVEKEALDSAMEDGTLIGELIIQLREHYRDCRKAGDYAAAGRYFDRMIKLTGLEKAKRVEISGVAGAPIQTESAATVDLTGLSDEAFKALGGALGEKDTED